MIQLKTQIPSIFNGRHYLSTNVNKLTLPISGSFKKSSPKLISICIGNNPQNIYYLRMKKFWAKKAGVNLQIVFVRTNDIEKIIKLIEKYNQDRGVSGIMIQLPFPSGFSQHSRDQIISSISPNKDVDGMNHHSYYTAPVVLAVDYILRRGVINLKLTNPKILVVGAKGFEGSKILRHLQSPNISPGIKKTGPEITGVDIEEGNLAAKTLQADVVVSTTGKADLITSKMVKTGCILIDVGYPRGDISPKAYLKAGFVSPVPGGVGPMTIFFLLKNTRQAYQAFI